MKLTLARVAAHAPATSSSPATVRQMARVFSWVARAGYGLIGAQFVVLIVTGTLLYQHWDVTNDYAFYSQAWYLIAHGNLDPYSSVIGHPFWKNHFELAMWPLAPLYWVTPGTMGLKWVQSAAAVGAELVAFTWVLDVLRRPGNRVIPPAMIAGGFIVIVLLNPNFYNADWFDFHFEAIATLLLVLAGRDLYNGRRTRALVWTGLMLLTGDVAALYAIGLGLAALVASRGTRKVGIAIVAAGGAWLALTSALGANVGSDLVGGLGYLAVGSHVTLTGVIIGLIVHPGRWAHVLAQRWHNILSKLWSGGVIGVLAPWVLLPSAAVLLPAALQQSIGYITSPFQLLPVLVLTPVGTVLVLEWFGRRAAIAPGVRRGVTVVMGLAVIAMSLAYAVPNLPRAKHNWFVVPPAMYHELSAVRATLRPGDQVIASSAISGGLGGRASLVPWILAPQVVPLVGGRTVVFVLAPDDPLQPIPAAMAHQAVAALAALPGSRIQEARDGVTTIRWLPPRRAVSVTLPTAKVGSVTS